MKNRQELFFPAHVAPESDTFVIEHGSQMTILAIGLQGTDYVEFQAVYVPSLDPDTCACPPGQVTLPSVADFVTLKCCGEPIRVTADNPVVVLDNPQRTFLRALLSADDTSGIRVWATETYSNNLNDRLRGCPCAEA